MRIVAALLAAFLLAPSHTTVEEAAMIAVEGEGAKYWPRWRGPSGQGLAMGKGYADVATGSADGAQRGIAAFDRAERAGGERPHEHVGRQRARHQDYGAGHGTRREALDRG